MADQQHAAGLPTQDDTSGIAHALFRMGASFDGFTSQMRRALTLNAHERLAIAFLWSRGPMTMTELGAAIPLSRAAVTTLVDRLEESGLVRRGSDVADRRRTVVELADAALDRMRPVLTEWGGGLAELVGSRSEEEWAAISRFLADFADYNDDHRARLAELSDEQIQALADLVS